MKKKIESLGRAGIVYRKGKEYIKIDSEGLSSVPNLPSIVIYYNTIKYWISSNGKRLVSDEERKEIARELEVACGGAQEVEWNMTLKNDWDGILHQYRPPNEIDGDSRNR